METAREGGLFVCPAKRDVPGWTLEYRLQLAQRLESILQREIDILDPQNCDGLVQYQALTKGVIVKSDPEMWEHLSRQALFFQADMLPQIRKARMAKVQRFVHGL